MPRVWFVRTLQNTTSELSVRFDTGSGVIVAHTSDENASANGKIINYKRNAVPVKKIN